MEKSDLKFLKEEIYKCKKELSKLELQAKKSANVQKVYNKLLVKKAVLMQKYKKLVQKPSIGEKIKKLLRIQTKKKLICDYFKTSVV